VSAKPGPKRKADPAKVMELRGQGMTQNEVAKALNIGQQRVAQIEAETFTSINDNIINTSISPKTKAQGNSKDYHDRRLKKEAPELRIFRSTPLIPLNPLSYRNQIAVAQGGKDDWQCRGEILRHKVKRTNPPRITLGDSSSLAEAS